MNMKETIRKILSEDMDWTKDIKSHIPNDSEIFGATMMVEMSLYNYLPIEYGYNWLTVAIADGRIIEFIIEGSHDIKIERSENVKEVDERYNSTGVETLEDYISEYDLDRIRENSITYRLITNAIPNEIIGIWVGDL